MSERTAPNGRSHEMLKRIAFGVVWTVVIGAAAMAVAEQPYEEYFDQTYPVASGVEVSLENVNGDVSVDVWDRNEVRVEAVKKASSADLLAKMEIEIEATQAAIDIETDLPSTSRRRGPDVGGVHPHRAPSRVRRAGTRQRRACPSAASSAASRWSASTAASTPVTWPARSPSSRSTAPPR